MNCQQFQLYESESRVPRGRDLSDPAELQAYVDAIRDTPYFERNFSEVLRIETHVRGSSKDGSVGSWRSHERAGVIEMAPVHTVELFVLHEVAHPLARARYGSRSHDPWFARTYLGLVREIMGPEAYVGLREAFIAGGIDFEHSSEVPGGLPLGPSGSLTRA